MTNIDDRNDRPAQFTGGRPRLIGVLLTVYGVAALTFMMLMYALEQRDSRYILAFALGCALSSGYGFASGVWPFGVVEAIWCVIAIHRYARLPRPDRA